MKWKCSTCNRVIKNPVIEVNVIVDHGHYFCVHCCVGSYKNGVYSLDIFPSPGKMIPDTILTYSNKFGG